MKTTRLRVADVFRQHWAEYDRTHKIAPYQRKSVRHILTCRTAALGGHLHRCEQCGTEVPLYNPCLDRHCPTCQTMAKQDWLEDRRAELLPVQYFHTVFTLPHDLNPLIDANRPLLLGELFGAVNWVLQHFATDPQWRLEGQLGFLAMLHTWTQKLQEHFHLHCIIPGGVWRAAAKPLGVAGRAAAKPLGVAGRAAAKPLGVAGRAAAKPLGVAGQTKTGKWVPCRNDFLFGKQALCDAFRNRYLRRLAALRRQNKLIFRGGATAALADPVQWDAFLRDLADKRWVARPQPTAAGLDKALDYLGRYVHRVAIGNHRILAIKNGQVCFSYRDRADGNRRKEMVLPATKFIKRFLYHILPPGFQKVRYYGWLGSANKTKTLAAIRRTLHVKPPPPPPEETDPERILRLTGVDVRRCPVCGKPTLTYLRILPPNHARGPP